MQIRMTSSYDLGIASGSMIYSDDQPINTWRERVQQAWRPSAP